MLAQSLAATYLAQVPAPSGSTVVQTTNAMMSGIERGGVIFVLALVALVFGFLYWRERERNEKLHKDILEASKEATDTLAASISAIKHLQRYLASAHSEHCETPHNRG